jgi:hypothetical protein
MRLSLNLNAPVTNPILHFANVDAVRIDLSPTSTTTGGAVSVTRLSGNNQFEVSGTLVNTAGQAINNGCEDNAGGNPNGGCGSIQLMGTYFDIVMNVSLPANGGGDGFGIAVFLPADYSDAPTPYPVAAHIVDGVHFLGTGVNVENRANTGDLFAVGDGLDDGVPTPVLVFGTTSIVEVNATGSGGLLQAWIDWSADGVFDTATEQIATNVADGGVGDLDGLSNGVIRLAVPVPSDAPASSIARFRWSTTPGLGPSGNAVNGEVEDYRFALAVAPIVFNKALGSNRIADTDQFTVSVRIKDSFGPPENDEENSTTSGYANEVTAGSGTMGTVGMFVGAEYVLTEDASGTTDLNLYEGRITCIDFAGQQPGLPTNAVFDAATGLTITPVIGAVISCTLTNTAKLGLLTLSKTVVNNGGGTASATAWTLAATGPTSISGSTGTAAVTAASVGAGTYTLSETGGPTGYTASPYNCVVNGAAPVSGNTIAINPGDTTVCTITNTFVPNPSLTIVKRLQTGTPTPLQANQIITYEFQVTNTGNVTLTGVSVNETAFNGSGTIGNFTPPNGSVTLAPGASTVYTATYTVSQTDVDVLQ